MDVYNDNYQVKRERLVNQHLRLLGITDLNVLNALNEVPRHLFVPEKYITDAYYNNALPIGYDQTISQPYIVALMTQVAQIKPEDKILEIGTGSGYQAAVLSRLTNEVYTIEIIEPLAIEAQHLFKKLGYNNIYSRIGNGYQGWPEQAPFDVIIITAAITHLPEPLIDQLKLGGRLIAPKTETLGRYNDQSLIRVHKTTAGLEQEFIASVRFVPFKEERAS